MKTLCRQIMLTKILLILSLVAGIGNVAVANPKNSQVLTNNSNSLADRNSRFKFLDTVAKAVTVKIYVGEDRVSGVLIERSSSIYTVVTNSNIVNRGNTYRIETPDGVVHDVTNSNQDSVLAIGGEVLILQFESTNTYKRALVDLDDVVDVEVGETVIAAGFPDDKDELLIIQGAISHLFDRSLGKGYQIEFTNEIVSGMNGGVLLDSKGAIIGVLGKGKDTLIDDVNEYQDGTFPTAEGAKKIENNKSAISIAGLRVGAELHLLDSQKEIAEETPESITPESIAQEEASDSLLGEEVARTINEPKKRFVKKFPKIDRIAEQVTVRIDTVNDLKEKSNGSGVIIAKQGKTYYGITAKHVLCQASNKPRCQFNGTHQIVTANGKKYQLDNQTIVKSKGYDLAIFSFESDQDYQVATFGNYSLKKIDSQGILVSGFPNVEENPDLKRIITVGQLHQGKKDSLVKDSFSLADKGQGLLYTNVSYGGMSGGAVLDADGNLLGINTGAEGEALIDESGSYQDDVILGFSLGIPTQDILNFLETETSFETKKLEKTQKKPEVIDFGYVSIVESDRLLEIAQKPKDDKDLAGWMNYGNQLWRFGKNLEAVQAFEKVTKIDPTFDKAYYAMGLAYYSDPVYSSLAIRAFSKATETNPNLYYFWRYLGLSYFEAGFGKSKFKEYDRAAKAYEEAIKKNQSEADSRINFVLYSEYANLLHAAGKHLHAAGKYRKSLNAFNQAIAINPDNSSLYLNRALVRESLKQYKQAAVDYSKAIENYSGVIQTLNLVFAIDRLYLRRGFVYAKLNQYQKAIADLDKVIEIEPKDGEIYLFRGEFYEALNQYEKALSDYKSAIKLNNQDFRAYFKSGNIYGKLTQFNKALNDYDRSLQINPRYALTYQNRGIVYALLGNFAKAKDNVEEAARLYQEQKNTQEYQKTLQVLETIKLEEQKNNAN